MIIKCMGVALIGAYLQCEIPDQPKSTVVVCPPVIAWSAADQQAAAAELERLPAGHPLRRMGAKFVDQRMVVKACQRSSR